MRRLLVLALVATSANAARADDPRKPPAAEYRARVELNKQRHATLTAKLTCSVPAKCPEWVLDLGSADRVDLLRIVDLRGEPTRVRYGDPHAEALPESARWPAAFVRIMVTDAANTLWERWLIVSLEGGRAKRLWQGEIAMKPATGGGFSTSDGIELVATEPGQPLALAFDQLSAPTEKARRPAQPLHRKFVIKDGTYQRP